MYEDLNFTFRWMMMKNFIIINSELFWHLKLNMKEIILVFFKLKKHFSDISFKKIKNIHKNFIHI
jgi:hypothetical protein